MGWSIKFPAAMYPIPASNVWEQWLPAILESGTAKGAKEAAVTTEILKGKKVEGGRKTIRGDLYVFGNIGFCDIHHRTCERRGTSGPSAVHHFTRASGNTRGMTVLHPIFVIVFLLSFFRSKLNKTNWLFPHLVLLEGEHILGITELF